MLPHIASSASLLEKKHVTTMPEIVYLLPVKNSTGLLGRRLAAIIHHIHISNVNRVSVDISERTTEGVSWS